MVCLESSRVKILINKNSVFKAVARNTKDEIKKE